MKTQNEPDFVFPIRYVNPPMAERFVTKKKIMNLITA